MLVFNLQTINIYSILLRLILSIIIAGIIGYERERKREFAGMRTYMLIALGSCMAMLTNQYIFEAVAPGVDPSRMGAQVLSGIGFLGVGTILVIGGHKIKGLTTAAGLWATASIGLACGIGFYWGAIVSGFIVFMTLGVLRRFGYRNKNNLKKLWYYMEVDEYSTFEVVAEFLGQQNISVSEISVSKENHIFQINFILTLKEKEDLTPLVNEVLKKKDIITFREDRNL